MQEVTGAEGSIASMSATGRIFHSTKTEELIQKDSGF